MVAAMMPEAPAAIMLKMLRHLSPPTSANAPTALGGRESDNDREGAMTDPGYYLRNNEFIWRLTWAVALAGRADVAHQMRADLLAETAKALTSIEAMRQETKDASVVREIDAVSADLRRKLAYRSARWQTAEDLEYLAAESLVPPNDELRKTRDALPFPQGWQEPGEKPF